MIKSEWCRIAIVTGIGCILSVGGGRAVSTDPPLDPKDANVYWRWIRIGPNCPLPPAGWTMRPLFPPSSIPGSCPKLNEFCLYEKPVGSVDPEPDPEILGASAGPDLMALAPAGGILSSDEIATLERHFEEQMGKIAALPDHTGGRSLPEVRLTIVDTSPDTAVRTGRPESSPHGESLISFAKRLLCNSNDGDCKVGVGTRLALAYKFIDPENQENSIRDDLNGGYVGLISELAEALIHELRWKNSSGDHLVLNLSLAWDRIYGGSEPQVDDMPAPVQAVYRALECVACQGAMVVAAAGNFSDVHPSNTHAGPLFPAAWTERAAGLCANTPLLYAAGGVDVARRPLTSSLPDGKPEFAVYSDHAIITDPETATETAILSGTSVAALGLSVTAAAVAYYAPDLSTQQVFDIIYQEGEQTGMTADFCHSSSDSCPGVRYVSLCEAVRAACQGDQGKCLQTPECSIRSNQFVQYSGVPSGNFTHLVDGSNLTVYESFSPPGACGSDLPVFATSSPENPCPRWQYHGLPRKSGTHPQPQSDKCPTCIYEKGSAQNSGTFYGEITLSDDEYLEDLTLILSSCAVVNPPYPPYHPYFFQPIQGPLNNCDTIKLSDLPTCDSAALSYTLYSESKRLGSMTVPILVVRSGAQCDDGTFATGC